jgi:hypothetical protein
MEFVEKMYNDNKEILDFLSTQNEISYKVDLDSKLKKIILMSSASYFESQMTELIESFVVIVTANNIALVSFVRNKAINRQYHTLFDWKSNNINGFLGLFGLDFKKEAIADINASEKLKSAVTSFLLIGSERNKLVHINFATFLIDLTSDEIIEHHRNALLLIDYLKKKLSVF